MTVVKQAVFLQLLLVVSTYADHANQKENADHADCENLSKTLPSKDLHKSFGDWVLVYSVADQRDDLMRNLTSSHIQVRLLDDNKTVTYKEWNKFIDGSCASYFIKTSLAEDRADHDHHTVPINGYHYEKNGKLEWHNETGEIQFFQTCDDCLLSIFKGEGRQFFLSYRREGHHGNVTQLRERDDHHDRQAKCLGFSHEEMFHYDGAAETCSKETPKSLNEHLEHHDHHDHHDHHGHHGHHEHEH